MEEKVSTTKARACCLYADRVIEPLDNVQSRFFAVQMDLFDGAVDSFLKPLLTLSSETLLLPRNQTSEYCLLQGSIQAAFVAILIMYCSISSKSQSSFCSSDNRRHGESLLSMCLIMPVQMLSERIVMLVMPNLKCQR